MLKYSLRENLLTADPDDCMAQVQDVRSYSQDEIIDLMMRRGTTLTRADVAAVLQVYTEVVGELTAGGILRLTGSRIKFDASDMAQGVFLVPESGGEAVRCSVVAENKPARVMVMIPADIASGTYYAEVRSRFMGNSQAGKTLKSGRFGKPMEVAAQG